MLVPPGQAQWGAGPARSMVARSVLAAAALAPFQGNLQLSVPTLDAEAAAALAEFGRGGLALDIPTTLDAAAAAALAEFKGRELSVTGTFTESVGGPTPLTPEVARLIRTCAEYRESGASLPSVTALDTPDAVEIAGILAAIKGLLDLPNLRTISPKTLTALIEKDDISIPLLDTLELIAEPDGSVTEDFVVPEGFEARQQRQLQ